MKLLVVNARHIKAVPGRKTDVKDAEWIADLLRHGLLRGSYIPDRGQRELRELVRYRRRLIEERSREAERLHKTLEGANVKLGAVASNILGVSGRAMLEALVSGRDDPEALAALAKGRLRDKHERLVAALRGLVGPHQRRLLATQLRHIDFLDAEIAGLSAEIEERMRPFDPAIELADTIPGVGRRTAEAILAEIGTDMGRFPSDRHLASWARICPGTDESAGKRKSGAIGPGKHLAPLGPRRGGPCGSPDEGHVPCRPVPPDRRPPGRQASRRRRRSHDPRDPVPHAPRRSHLRGPRSALLRRARPAGDRWPIRPPP